MKKILLASTALVLSAGIAQAQGTLRISGEGRMGVISERIGGVTTTWMENRLQLDFTATSTGDHGLSFGAAMRVRGNDAATGVFNGNRVWVEANGLRLQFGNVDGAIRGAGASHGYAGGCGIGYVGGWYCGDSAGLLGVTHGRNSTGGGAQEAVRLDYTMGDFAVAISTQGPQGGVNRTTEIGAKYSFDAFTVAAGYRPATNGMIPTPRVLTASGHYNGGSWGVGAIVARIGNTTNGNISGSVELGGGTAYAYIGRVGGANAGGVNYSYGLGAGSAVTAGVERVGGATAALVGVTFTF